MSNKRNIALAVVAVLSVVLIALLVVVLVTGTGSSSSEGLDKARAADLSKAALLAPTDLMGSGWRTKTTDAFPEDTTGYSSSPACQEQKAAFEDILKSKPLLAGRSEKSYQLTGANPPLVIDEWVEVYNSDANAKDLLPKVERLMGDSMVTCTNEGLGSGVKASRTTPRVEAPSGGKVIAMEFKAPNTTTGALRSEYYYWRFGNVGISLTFNGQQERLTTDLIKSTIDKVQEDLKKAASFR